MARWSLHHGDCLEWLRTLPSASVDALEARCNEVNAKIDALRDVWKAIEWEESGDTGPDETAAVIAAYEAKQ